MTTTHEKELKACPFCGAPGKCQKEDGYFDGYGVSCGTPGCYGNSELLFQEGGEAITAWNTRARDAEFEEFEEVVGVLGDLVGNYSEMTAQNSFERRVFQQRMARAREILTRIRGGK